MQIRTIQCEDDIVIEADVNRTGAPGDLILKIGGEEVARIRNSGVATGMFAGPGSVPTVPPSGDPTGAEDAGQINAMFAAEGGANLKHRAYGGYLVNSSLVMPDFCAFNLNGAYVKLADGSNCDMVTNADHVNGNEGGRIRGGTLDGNKAHQSPGAGVGIGCEFFLTKDFTAENLELENMYYRGFVYEGNSGNTIVSRGIAATDWCRRNTVTGLRAHNCGSAGLTVTNGSRESSLSNIRAFSNGTRNVYLDASECIAYDIYSYLGLGDGIYIHNVFNCGFKQFVSYKNNGYGIGVLGMVDSKGGDWVTNNNSLGTPGAADDIYFSGDQAAGGYGLSGNTILTGIESVSPPSGGPETKRYGIYIDDPVGGATWPDLKINGAFATSGLTGDIRLPGSPGNIRIANYFAHGSSTVSNLP